MDKHEHTFAIVLRGEGDSAALMVCHRCGLSFRYVLYPARYGKESRAAWEIMKFESPEGEQISIPSCNAVESE